MSSNNRFSSNLRKRSGFYVGLSHDRLRDSQPMPHAKGVFLYANSIYSFLQNTS